MVQEQVFGDIHTRPSHPELEAAAIAVITTFQVSLYLGFLEFWLITRLDLSPVPLDS
jgi:hypothetical protein